MNLLTEDNLPYYTNTLLAHAPKGHPIVDWNHQWTMEENRHSMVMRDWVHVSRCIDPTSARGRPSRPDGRRARCPSPRRMADLICYVSFQERATQIAHRNTGAHLPKDDKMGRNVLALVAGDETKHYLFYRDLALAAFAIDPSTMMIAAAKQVDALRDARHGDPELSPVTRCASRARVSTGSASSCATSSTPVLELWDVDHLSGLSDDAERARIDLAGVVERLRVSVERLAAKAAGATPATI